jgi:hypothetical protein
LPQPTCIHTDKGWAHHNAEKKNLIAIRLCIFLGHWCDVCLHFLAIIAN